MNTASRVHPECAEVARLVAAEITTIEQAFARRAAAALKALTPPGDDLHARALRRGITLSIHTLLAHAGLTPDTSPAEVKR